MSNIHYSESFKKFLLNSDCKIAKILYRLNCKRYDSILLTDKEINYITFRTDGTISFLPSGKEHFTTDTGEWKRENRQNGKPSKVIRKIMCKKMQSWFTDSDYESFANQYKANYCADGYKFELLNNNHIPDVYEMDMADGEGSIRGSCMNGDSKYLGIYKNCDKLQILILKNKEGLLSGRALVWKISDEITLMDRIYVSQDFQYDLFLSYAKDQMWYRKENYKTYDYKESFVSPSGELIRKQFTIQTDTTFDYYPYIDTFQYGGDGYLNNYWDGYYTYNNTDGTRQEEEEENHDRESYDDLNDEWIDNDNACYIEDGDSRYRGRTTNIDNCVMVGDSWYHEHDSHIIEVNGEWYTKDDPGICEVGHDYYLMEDCVYSEYDSCFYLMEDCVYSEHHNSGILSSDSIEVNDEYYHTDDIGELIVKIEDDYYLIDSEDIECVNGEYQLKVVSEED